MADFNEISNTPIEMELGGKKYKVRRVPLTTIFGKAESAVISRQMKRVYEMAERLSGEEKTSFLTKAMVDSIPSGEKLTTLASEYLRSLEGVKMVLVDAMIRDQPNIERELDIATALEQESQKVNGIVSFAVGRTVDEKASVPFEGSKKP